MERGEGSKGPSAALIVNDEMYEHWKYLVPVLYDWITHHHLYWPSLSCRWGPIIKGNECSQYLYLAEQTNGTYPDTLIAAVCQIKDAKVAAPEHISEFNEETRSPFVKKCSTLIHPGEVNRIRELPQNKDILATHTDSPDVFIWNWNDQPARLSAPGVAKSRPDAILTGHTENAQFALAMCHTEPFVLSGGQDKSVVLWSIGDYITSLGLEELGSKDSLKIGPRGVFQGHDATVEDVQFCPSSAQEFCSVGDDSCLILWDARSGNAPVVKVQKAHDNDVHCVDWNATDANLILTGSADHTVRMFDRRNLTANGVGSPIQKFEDHMAPVVSVQWSPHTASVFASAADDGILKIWDHDQVGKKTQYVKAKLKPSAPGLLFQHIGHRAPIVDFHWNPVEPWTIASVSSNVLTGGHGGTLQIWCVKKHVYRDEEEVIAKLAQSQKHQETSSPPAESKKSNVSSPAAEPNVSSPADEPNVSSPMDEPNISSPADEPNVFSPAADSNDSNPAAEPNVSSPVAEPNISSPTAEPNISSPAVETNLSSLAAETNLSSPAAEPNLSSSAAEPNVSSPVAEPNISSPAAESNVSSPAAEPNLSSPAAEPNVSSPAAEPNLSSPAAEPNVSSPAESNVSSPAAESNVSSPAAEPNDSRPAAEPNVSSPAAEPNVSRPAAEPNVSSPAAESHVSSPAESNVSSPAAESNVSSPAAEPNDSRPAAEPNVSSPAAEPNVSSPAAEPNVSRPAAGPNVSSLAAEPNVSSPAAESNVSSPAAEPNVSSPAAESNVSSPAAESNVSRPAAEPNVSSLAAESNVSSPAAEPNVSSPAAEPNVSSPAAESNVSRPAAEPNVSIPAAESNVSSLAVKSRSSVSSPAAKSKKSKLKVSTQPAKSKKSKPKFSSPAAGSKNPK